MWPGSIIMPSLPGWQCCCGEHGEAASWLGENSLLINAVCQGRREYLHEGKDPCVGLTAMSFLAQGPAHGRSGTESAECWMACDICDRYVSNLELLMELGFKVMPS